MSGSSRIGHALLWHAVAVAAIFSGTGYAQDPVRPVNDLPNPYQTIQSFFKLAEGRWWDSTSAVDVDIDGKSIWIAERCAQNSCAGSRLNPVLKFDETGRLVKRFGERMFNLPHGIHVDREGNVWVTDAQGPDGKDRTRNGKGHAVYKFSPEGVVLLTLGKPGVAGDGTGDLLNGPSDVVTAPNGDIFVADGHAGDDVSAATAAVARIARFAKDGQLIKSWGKLGSGPGELADPHGLALDTRGRLFVADRGNASVKIFTQDGEFLEQWRQFGRPSGIFIDNHDTLYVSDSDSNEANNPGWRRGIRIGSARDGKVAYFIPDTGQTSTGGSGAVGVAADAAGNVYGAEVDAGAGAMKKYVRQ